MWTGIVKRSGWKMGLGSATTTNSICYSLQLAWNSSAAWHAKRNSAVKMFTSHSLLSCAQLEMLYAWVPRSHILSRGSQSRSSVLVWRAQGGSVLGRALCQNQQSQQGLALSSMSFSWVSSSPFLPAHIMNNTSVTGKVINMSESRSPGSLTLSNLARFLLRGN